MSSTCSVDFLSIARTVKKSTAARIVTIAKAMRHTSIVTHARDLACKPVGVRESLQAGSKPRDKV